MFFVLREIACCLLSNSKSLHLFALLVFSTSLLRVSYSRTQVVFTGAWKKVSLSRFSVLLIILADFSSAVVWTVSIFPLICRSLSLFNVFRTVTRSLPSSGFICFSVFWQGLGISLNIPLHPLSLCSAGMVKTTMVLCNKSFLKAFSDFFRGWSVSWLRRWGIWYFQSFSFICWLGLIYFWLGEKLKLHSGN